MGDMKTSAEKLVAWMDLKGLSGAQLADLLQVGAAPVCRWRQGKGRPNLAAALALERASDGLLPAAMWVDAPERADKAAP
jgi:transcriptional regulator with XRE-family HTH domain